MELGPNQAIKTLRDGASWHGGDHKWSLPVAQPDGTHTAGEWTPRIAPSICAKGWHLTTQPALWWSHEGNVAAYLAEYDGATSAREGEDKIAVERCRLLRPLTKAELESCGIFTDGVHEVKTGAAYASGSATVRAYGSATVRAYGSATVEAYGSATVRAYGSARTHTAGSAVCTAWRGTTLVLTRADDGVIIDRRGDTPKTYCKRAGLDGWRYADGKWERRAAKK
jgi:hypothetical protein